MGLGGGEDDPFMVFTSVHISISHSHFLLPVSLQNCSIFLFLLLLECHSYEIKWSIYTTCSLKSAKCINVCVRMCC